MKRFAALFFVLFVLVFSAPRTVLAATKVTGAASVKVSVTVSPTPTPAPQKIEYDLPYPGILPTHPLYFLKSLRDKIIESLIKDPVSKAEFYILQADKKVNMGLTLKQLGKGEEAKEAFGEAVEAHTKAIALVEVQLKNKNAVPRHILEKLSLSLAKHKEVLQAAGENVQTVTDQIAKALGLLGTK